MLKYITVEGDIVGHINTNNQDIEITIITKDRTFHVKDPCISFTAMTIDMRIRGFVDTNKDDVHEFKAFDISFENPKDVKQVYKSDSEQLTQ